jgi:hypothetical protein
MMCDAVGDSEEVRWSTLNHAGPCAPTKEAGRQEVDATPECPVVGIVG